MRRFPKDYRIPPPVADEVVEDSDEEREADDDETQSPVFDLAAPGTRPPGAGPVALGRGNARV